MFSLIFCDDNSQYLASLKNYVQAECSKMVPVGEDFDIGPAFGSGEEAIEYIKSHHVDLLLLDIDMPDMNGFAVAKTLSIEYPQIKIVFMSAYDHFVYSSFDYYPFAYLRKSHITEEMPKILRRFLEKIHQSDRQLEITTTGGIKLIDGGSILYVESKRNYYSLHLVHGNEYICRGTLTTFENQVSSYSFFRIHSAYLVNLAHVDRLIGKNVLLINGQTLPIAQKRTHDFKKAYMDYIRRCLNT